MAEKEYIEKAYLEKFIKDGLNNPDKSKAFGYDAIEILAEIHYTPPADVVEVVHGKWRFEHDPIKDPKKYFIRIVCSCCGLKTGQISNYCPSCGAKMDAGEAT